MLGYYLDTKNTKPGWRKLQVKLGRKDVDVRSRTGFFVTNATMNPLLTRDLDMKNALHSPIEGTGVPVTVEWVTVASDGDKKKAIFFAHMPADGLSFDTASHDQLNFDFAPLAFDKNGKEAGQAMQCDHRAADICFARADRDCRRVVYLGDIAQRSRDI
jgi:hypothetical protein